MGKVATQPLPPRGSPPLQSEGQNQKWPTCGQGGYITPAASGIPSASERGAKSEVAHLWAGCLNNPNFLGDPHSFRAGGRIRSGPVCGQGGYKTPAASGIPSASERGAESEVAHLWARWLHNPCRLGDPLRFRARGRIRSGPVCGQGGYKTPAASGIPSASERGAESEVAQFAGKVATKPLPPRGSPPPQSGGQNQKWPTCGQGGYITPAASGIPFALERGAESEVTHLWARCLHNPCFLWDPHSFQAGGKIRSGPLVGKVAT